MGRAKGSARLSRAEALEAQTQDIASFHHDPLHYVIYAFPWGEGELKKHAGPRPWQRRYLLDLGQWLRGKGGLVSGEAPPTRETRPSIAPIRVAVSSGHGIGKSSLVAWLILWSMSTFEDCRGVVTANTEPQLRGKTWPELAKWYRLANNRHWFKFTATSLYSANPEHEKTWRFDMVPWSEHKSEAFAGLHNKGKRVVAIFDEASAIPRPIWEVTEGALTDEDTEILWPVFGNPTRNTGDFHDCFGKMRHRWETRTIDSREVEGTNKELFDEWISDYGEDSDFVRVRVRGMFPRASSLQLIDTDLVHAAQYREAKAMLGDPLVMALDIARGGEDACVFRFRRGFDARSIKAIAIPGSEVRDSMRLVAKAADLIEEHKPDAFFYDATGVGGPVGDRIRQLGHKVVEVQFGATSPDSKYANMRACMYGRMREWLRAGGAIDRDPVLETDLTSVEYTHTKRDQLILESKESMKKRGLASPDHGDALAMTFAYPVAPTFGPGSADDKRKVLCAHEWDPVEDAKT